MENAGAWRGCAMRELYVRTEELRGHQTIHIALNNMISDDVEFTKFQKYNFD